MERVVVGRHSESQAPGPIRRRYHGMSGKLGRLWLSESSLGAEGVVDGEDGGVPGPNDEIAVGMFVLDFECARRPDEGV